MKRLFGGILLAIGILIAGASGLCSLAVLVSGDFGSGADLDALGIVAIVGGVPMVVGILIAFGGRSLLRSAREDEIELSE